MLWNLHIIEKSCHSCESRNPEVCSQTEIRIPAPCFRRDKFSEDDIYTRIHLLLQIYVELWLVGFQPSVISFQQSIKNA